MSEKIVIEFDSEENKKNEERIIVDFDETKVPHAGLKPEVSYEETILSSKINSCYRGNSHLNSYFESELIFPEGVEQGFRKMFNIQLNDEFFNSVLENNKYVILSSKNGSIYLIDRFSGKIKNKIFFEGEYFEKTGVVYENRIYVNSLKNIFIIDDENESKRLYSSIEDYLIWSNLNLYKNNLIFAEFNPALKQAFIKKLNVNDPQSVTEYTFPASNYVNDKICVANGCAYLVADNNLLIYDLETNLGSLVPLDIKVDETSFIFYLNYRIYITSHSYELYYLDIPNINFKFKYSGIKTNYINSIGGFDDNIFIGALDGWKFYKSSGLLVYNFEEEYESKIECISRNVIVMSQKNKIIFCNLNRFQEAEGYVIASNKTHQSIEIIASGISKNEIFILTKNGVLETFTNDKLNIHV